MSVLKTPPSYDSRSVKDWLAMATRGDVLLPNFQRSFVWKPRQTADYVLALLERRPTGIFLILEAEDPLPFKCRLLQGTGGASDEVVSGSAWGQRELVLDGQQRLTALWNALSGKGSKRYFIRVQNLLEADLEVKEVTWRAHTWSNPRKMADENWIPADILWNNGLGSSDSAGSPAMDIQEWCQQALGEEWVYLYEQVSEMRSRLVMEPQLQYCVLRKDTDRDTSIDIFINVNRSAVKLKEVDIAVALAEADHGVDLRSEVEAYLGRSAQLAHYFSPTLSRAIPEVAEWMLKVSCLRVRSQAHPNGLAPSTAHYPSAVRALCGSDSESATSSTTESRARLKRLEEDLDIALRFAAERGGATKRTLPAWPPVHVIAALQDDIRAVRPALGELVDRLLSAYLWRAFVTTRYQALANARLLEDYRALRRYLTALAGWKKSGGAKPALAVPAFDNEEYKLPDTSQLSQVGWIGRASRPGRAIAAVAMQGNPRDWITGERLDPARVRRFERAGKLERHHVFPPALFELQLGDKVHLGLNGVLLSKSAKVLKACDPADLLAAIRVYEPNLDELELRTRLHSHQVSKLALEKVGAAPFRYHQFIKDRAQAVATRISELTTFTA